MGVMWDARGFDGTNAWGDGGCDEGCMWKVVGFIQGSWGCTQRSCLAVTGLLHEAIGRCTRR